jgi:electron transport complex protein RnfD
MAEAEATQAAEPVLHVAPAPHLYSGKLTTRRMMLDVLIGLSPVLVVALLVFRWYALRQLAVCVASCLCAEWLFTAMRRRPCSLGDCSAVVTGVILALSIPGTAPPHVGLIAGFAAIGLGKIIFGSLGQNIFNPAMVGRAFVMLAFSSLVGASGYVDADSTVNAVTSATPMTAAFKTGQVPAGLLWRLFLGNTNGSPGETSALACLLGGLYLCLRRTASWEIPLSAIAAVALIGGIVNLADVGADWTVLHHLLGGAFLFGAFFIATDPVTTPLTLRGKMVFGFGFGVLVMVIRLLTFYPEGVMFSVLLMNSVVPLINRWTIPRPVGGPVPQPAEK